MPTPDTSARASRLRAPGPKPPRLPASRSAPATTRPSPTAASVPAFDYALIRVVPHVPLGDGETVGAILQCRQKRFIGIAWAQTPEALAERFSQLNADLVARYLHAMERVAEGEGPIGKYTASERFHWLTATRSTVIRCSPVHTGLTDDPAASLERIAAGLR
ncbi:MAG TPA: DUF3037 domain-containing protein [Bacteroidetes bacterium]|nr:DUF3037 domain-containing protein [Bacteroidota bacterium]HIL58863.1 DUF3037 domain-containing protein [Rhodothermales bacterium]